MEDWLEVYCQIYEDIYKRVSKLNPEKATETALGIFREIIRDLAREETKVEQKENQSLATKRQREALHKFGVKRIPENLSLNEASEILDRLISLSKANDRENIGKVVEELNQSWKEAEPQQPKK